MTASYDDLVGGDGRRVFYRPPRYRPRKLIGELSASMRIGGERVRVHDLSLTGASFFTTEERTDLHAGQVLPVVIHVGEEPAVDGTAEVVRRDVLNGRSKWAVRFLDTLARPAALQQIRDRIWFRRALEQGTSTFEAVPEEYRRVCHEASLVLRYWKMVLDRRPMRAPAHTSAASDQSALTDEESSVLDQMRIEWNRVRATAGECLPEVYSSSRTFRASKALTELLVTPLTLDGAIWSRAYRKPLGYPGDYVLMNYMYDATPRGDTPFARVLHQLGREERLAATVNSRKELLLDWLRRAAKERVERTESCLRVLSLGSGPGREIEEFVSELEADLVIDVCLVDQDEDALGEAYERIMRASMDRGARVTVRCRFVSFRDLFARPDLISDVGGRDLVFSAGLFDYLGEAPAATLAAKLFSILTSGGSLLIGNAADAATVKWVPEFVLDWRMHYRSESDLDKIAVQLPSWSTVRQVRDASGAWHFLHARKEEHRGVA